MLVYEYAHTTTARCGNFIPQQRIYNRTGFRSVFMFDDTDPNLPSGNSRNLHLCVPYCQILPIDIDHPQHYTDILPTLQQLPYQISVYSSGSKGYHIEIPTTLASGHGLPKHLQSIALQIAPLCDVSLYRHSSLYRLPNTIHSKTNQPKTLIYTKQGTILQLDTHYVYIPTRPLLPIDNTVTTDAGFVFSRIATIMHNQPTTSRYITLWSIGRQLLNSTSLTRDSIEDILNQINQSWHSPKTKPEMEHVFHDVFKPQ